jgi:hypothetical protein
MVDLEATGVEGTSAITSNQLNSIEWFDGKRDAQAWIVGVERLGKLRCSDGQEPLSWM